MNAKPDRSSTWPLAWHQVVREVLRWGKGIPGLWRLRHHVLNYERVRFPEKPVLTKLRYGPSMWVRPNDPIGRAIFYDGYWEPPIIEHFFRNLQSGDVVLDVGANIGQFTLVACKKVGPLGKVIAVEAGSSAWSLLRKNIDENSFTNVVPVHLAAWHEETTVYLDGVREDMLGWGTVSSAQADNKEAVPASRLDSLLEKLAIEKVNVIKMDIEGAEMQALRGLVRTMEFTKPRLIYCELANNHAEAASDPEEVMQFFAEYGYSGAILEDSGTTPLHAEIFTKPVNITAVFSQRGKAT